MIKNKDSLKAKASNLAKKSIYQINISFNVLCLKHY